ncbi:MAG: hypothetical protein EXS63_03020 [Candidatus Omnitrophica bacterium]|nr:hypothetical protein [Candidatus Omnitrophota bacterium]
MKNSGLGVLCLLFVGCASIFGWNIHAPGVLSESFYPKFQTTQKRVALYLPDRVLSSISKNRGGKFADPQTYYLGESFTPMVIEGFQQVFDELLFLEAEPSPAILKKYSISYLVMINMKDFGNDVTMKGQAVRLTTEVQIYDQEAKLIKQYEALGSSDAQKIFSKKGGPEVNLNAAIENNIVVTLQFLQDFIRGGNHE